MIIFLWGPAFQPFSLLAQQKFIFLKWRENKHENSYFSTMMKLPPNFNVSHECHLPPPTSPHSQCSVKTFIKNNNKKIKLKKAKNLVIIKNAKNLVIESITWQWERDGEWPNEARKDVGFGEMVGQRDDQYKGRVQWGEEPPTIEWATDKMRGEWQTERGQVLCLSVLCLGIMYWGGFYFFSILAFTCPNIGTQGIHWNWSLF